MQALNWADWLLLGVILISSLISLKRGFAREILSLISWLAAFVVAFVFSDQLAQLLSAWIETPSVRITVAMAGLFAMTLVVGAMVNHLIADFLDKTGLKNTDRLFGMVFGFIRGFIIVMVLVMVAKTSFTLDIWWQQSKLIPYFLSLESWFLDIWTSAKNFFDQLLAGA